MKILIQIITAFFLKKRFKVLKNRRGFTMMEILVAVAIVGILGAISMPRFQQYMKDAKMTAKDTSLKNVGRAFGACAVLKSLNECDSLEEMGIKDLASDSTVVIQKSTTGVDRLCVGIQNTIGGVDIKSCVQANVQGGVTFTSNKGFCYKQGSVVTVTSGCGTGAYTCKTAAYDKDCPACGDTTKAGSFCSVDADCGSGYPKCHSGDSGVCATGDCG